MSSPALNPLVTKIRGMHPGVYDDMDDASLTKAVLAKYPQYSDLAAGAPPQRPNVNMQQVDITGKPQNPSAGMAGVPGGSSSPQPASNAYAATVGAPVGAAAAYMGGASALPFIAPLAKSAHQWVGQNPVKATIALEAAKQLPGTAGQIASRIPTWLPLLAGGQAAPAAAAEGEAAASTDQLPGRPYMPNPRYEPPPEPAPLPQRTGPLLLKGNTPPPPEPVPKGQILPPSTDQLPGRPYMPNPRYQVPPETAQPIPQRQGLALPGNVEQPQAPKPVSMGKLPWLPNLEKSLGNEPMEIKPGVAMKNQTTLQPSSAVEAYHYDPDAREFHVRPKGGATGYVYGDVSPEDAQAFEAAPSKGKAWQQIRNNPLVGKVVNGQRVAVKPTRTDQGNDLTDILTKSLQAAKVKSGDN